MYNAWKISDNSYSIKLFLKTTLLTHTIFLLHAIIFLAKKKFKTSIFFVVSHSLFYARARARRHNVHIPASSFLQPPSFFLGVSLIASMKFFSPLFLRPPAMPPFLPFFEVLDCVVECVVVVGGGVVVIEVVVVVWEVVVVVVVVVRFFLPMVHEKLLLITRLPFVWKLFQK